MTAEQIGNEIKRARKAKNYTQFLMAGLMGGKSRTCVERAERETANVTVKKLIEALDCVGLELEVKPKKQ